MVEPVAPVTDNATPQEVPQKPPNIPDKFWDAAAGQVRVDDLGKSYGELEKKLGAPRPADPATLAIPAAPVLSDEDGVADIIGKAGLDPEVVGAAYRENGELADEHYAALKKIGYPRKVVNDFLKTESALAKAREAQLVEAAAKVVGGADKLTTLREWAKTGLSDGEKASYQRMIDDEGTALAGVEWLQMKYNAAAGASGSRPLISGGVAGGGGAQAFGSQQEIIVAMRDPRYAPTSASYDAAYRDSILRKLAASPISKDLPRYK